MSDEMGGIREKADEIARESVEKSAEIVEGAKQALGGDVKEGVANILKAAARYRHRCDRKGHWNCGRRPWQGEEPETRARPRARPRASRSPVLPNQHRCTCCEIETGYTRR